MLAAGEMRALPTGEQLSVLWPRVWALTDDDGSKSPPSDGTEVQWLASRFSNPDADPLTLMTMTLTRCGGSPLSAVRSRANSSRRRPRGLRTRRSRSGSRGSRGIHHWSSRRRSWPRERDLRDAPA